MAFGARQGTRGESAKGTDVQQVAANGGRYRWPPTKLKTSSTEHRDGNGAQQGTSTEPNRDVKDEDQGRQAAATEPIRDVNHGGTGLQGGRHGGHSVILSLQTENQGRHRSWETTDPV